MDAGWGRPSQDLKGATDTFCSSMAWPGWEHPESKASAPCGPKKAGATQGHMGSRKNTLCFWGLQSKLAPKQTVNMLRHSKLQTVVLAMGGGERGGGVGDGSPGAGVGAAGVNGDKRPQPAASHSIQVGDSTETHFQQSSALT